jgi:hypothetical protein
MNKLFTVLAASALIAELSASTYSATGFDAITAATVNNMCKFNYPLSVTATSAAITWTERRSGGTAKFSWGTDQANLTTRAMTATERANSTIAMTGLQAGTTYYIRVEMTKSGETPYAATGSFTTLAATAVRSSVPAANRVPLSISATRIDYGTTILPGDRITILDMQGRTVLEHVARLGEQALSLQNLQPAGAVVSVYRGYSLITRNAFVIGR